MTYEDQAISNIKAQCNHRFDLQRNEVELDRIILDFLRLQGFEKLADVVDGVHCWRA